MGLIVSPLRQPSEKGGRGNTKPRWRKATMKYQTPQNQIIEGRTPESAIQKLRVERRQTDKYFDFCYNWELHSDGIHLIQKSNETRRTTSNDF